MITVTEDAIRQMNSILEKKPDAVVRYELKGGGCGGLIAKWDTELHYNPEEGEMTWPLEDGVFVVDESTAEFIDCLLYTSPSPRDVEESRMPSSA